MNKYWDTETKPLTYEDLEAGLKRLAEMRPERHVWYHNPKCEAVKTQNPKDCTCYPVRA